MTRMWLVVVLGVAACGQSAKKADGPEKYPTKATVKMTVVKNPHPWPKGETLVTEGMWCPYATLPLSFPAPWYWKAGEIWNCVKDTDDDNGKWHRDLKEEKTRDRIAAVKAVVTERRLTSEEMKDLASATYDSPYPSNGGMLTCSGDHCLEKMECAAMSQQTATLIAQLSFWNPSEGELPLKLLQSYVKGMSCEAGTQRAYEIMNTRISEWLQGRYPK